MKGLTAAIGVAILLALLPAAGSTSVAQPAAVAVFPVANLSGGSAPAGIREFLVQRLATAGVRVLADAALEDFITRHRVRYTAGVDPATAEALRKETGVEGVVIPSLELSSEAAPPKIGLFARLVSITAAPAVVWADEVGLAGDDAPGWFELGVENDYGNLLSKALGRLSASLLGYLGSGEVAAGPRCADTFRPRSSYRSPAIDAGKSHSVAVLPFYNLSARRDAGDILALHFVRHMAASPRFRVADAGTVRQQLLDARIIMEGGVSISDAETVAALVDADFVLGGRVILYDDYEGPAGTARVEFSTVLVDRRSRRIVWSSTSYNDGTDGTGWFERGTVRTAHAMATQMVKLTTEMIAGPDR